jgi:uncharacterized protein with PIN domain
MKVLINNHKERKPFKSHPLFARCQHCMSLLRYITEEIILSGKNKSDKCIVCGACFKKIKL